MDFDFIGYLANLFGSQPEPAQRKQDDALIQQHQAEQAKERQQQWLKQFNPVVRSREGDDSWTDESKSWIQKDPKEEDAEFANVKERLRQWTLTN